MPASNPWPSEPRKPPTATRIAQVAIRAPPMRWTCRGTRALRPPMRRRWPGCKRRPARSRRRRRRRWPQTKSRENGTAGLTGRGPGQGGSLGQQVTAVLSSGGVQGVSCRRFWIWADGSAADSEDRFQAVKAAVLKECWLDLFASSKRRRLTATFYQLRQAVSASMNDWPHMQTQTCGKSTRVADRLDQLGRLILRPVSL
jgi:hypothetical protein